MLKSYSSYFVSFLLNNLSEKEINNLDKIILFGSVARNEATKESDVDIFIEIFKKTKKFEERIKKITEEFYKSREALLFKTKGVDNKINIIAGKLSEWKELKLSIESTGIILYGRFSSTAFNKENGKKYAIFFWDKIEKNRGAFLNKVYGFTLNGKRHPGLIELFNGKKLGKSSVMFPVENKEKIIPLFKHYKVSAKVIEIYA